MFEQWATVRGGLKPKQSRSEAAYKRRASMHLKWRKSSEFRAWVPEHESKCDSGRFFCGCRENDLEVYQEPWYAMCSGTYRPLVL